MFKLDGQYIKMYKNIKPKFGFNGLGEFIFHRTYSRIKKNNKKEQWYETVERVVNGTYNIQKSWIINHKLGWNEQIAQGSAQEMYERIFNMKFLPPGRGLWSMGTETTDKRQLYAALNNCGFVSTDEMVNDSVKPFCFLMDALMLGVGVGFDTKGAGTIIIKKLSNISDDLFIIPDSREGWVESLGKLLTSYFITGNKIIFDYSLIRKKGEKIKGFGGTSSGPDPLQNLHIKISNILNNSANKYISVRNISDIMNLIGVCVVSGNVRRCLPGDSLIHTKNGLIPIKNIKIGQKVLTSKGYNIVSDWVEQGNQQLIKIITQDGFFRCTPNHRMPVLTSFNSFVWKEAINLQVNDRLITSRTPIPGIQTQLPTCKNITIPDFDADMSWLIGIFQTNGYTYVNRKKNESDDYVSISFGIDHLHIAKQAQTQLQRFGDGLHITLKKIKNENMYLIHCYSKQLALYFDSYVKQSNTKLEIPQWILQSTIDIRLAYIAGLFDGDGYTFRCTNNRPIIVSSNIYKHFAHDIQSLLYSCGIESRLRLQTKLPTSRKGWRLSHNLILITKRSKKIFNSIPQFQKNIPEKKKCESYNGFPISWCTNFESKYELYDEHKTQFNIDSYDISSGIENKFCPVKVIDIVDDIIEPTYDISVDTNHEFYCNGYLTHNSALINFGKHNSDEFLDLKNYEINPERAEYGWVSNNSIFAKHGMDYSDICDRISRNGEPGLAWMDNMKEYGRMGNNKDYKDHRASGGNPCLEQTLESYELCCCTGNTRIQTKTGIPKIIDVVGNEIEIWNGESWSMVTPFLASKNKKIYRVYISDGSYLDCTCDHKWCIIPKTSNKYKQVKTKNLNIGDSIVPFNIDHGYFGIYEPNAYEYGLFLGDGYIDENRPMLCVHNDKLKIIEYNSNDIWHEEYIDKNSSNSLCLLNFKNILNLKIAKKLNNKFDGLPESLFTWDRVSILKFVAGLIDSNGEIHCQNNNDSYKIFGDERKIRDLQLLIRRIGINNSIIKYYGKTDESSDMIYAIYCLYIPSYESGEIPTKINITNHITNRYEKSEGKIIDKATKQKIIKIEKLENNQNVYCFNEPIKHMGVFGNVLTHQCLVETFPYNHDNINDYLRTLKFAYLYAKTVTLGKTQWPETNRVLLRNRRIGCSMSGITQFINKYGISKLKEYMEEGYNSIQKYDKIYSDWLAIPRSIKTTSIKPSGTVSLLAGATPGIHYPESNYYIRRVRLNNRSQLLKPLYDAGYNIVPSDNEPDTVVIEFPIKISDNIRKIKDVSMWEQLGLAAFAQRYWADNQVSCTVTFDPITEGSQLKYALDLYQYQLKGISFLPKIEKGCYSQLPYESISRETYDLLISNIKSLDFSDEGSIDDIEIEKYCDNDSCQI